MKRLLTMAALLAVCAVTQSQESSNATRYVWASTLIMRAEPNTKAAEVVRLAYGSQVGLLAGIGPSRREVLVKLAKNDEWPAAEVALEGNWQRVHTSAGEGWVFDAYLSHYPAPAIVQDKNGQGEDGRVEFAKRIFGVKEAHKWAFDSGKKADDYRIMLAHTKLQENEVDEEVSWEFVVFKNGATYEMFNHRPKDSVYMGNVDFKDMPLTYGEALLWLKQFHGFESMGGNNVNGVGKLSGKVEPRRHLELGPAPDDDSGFGYGTTLDCTPTACSLNSGFAD